MCYKTLFSTDASVLFHLHYACFQQRAWSESDFETLLANPVNNGWLVLKEEIPCGFILLQQVEEEAEILTFAVHPSHQRQGIGQALLQFSILALKEKKVERLFLDVAFSNRNALNLYRKIGFVAVKTRVGYYRDLGESAYVFRLDLQEFTRQKEES